MSGVQVHRPNMCNVYILGYTQMNCENVWLINTTFTMQRVNTQATPGLVRQVHADSTKSDILEFDYDLRVVDSRWQDIFVVPTGGPIYILLVERGLSTRYYRVLAPAFRDFLQLQNIDSNFTLSLRVTGEAWVYSRQI